MKTLNLIKLILGDDQHIDLEQRCVTGICFFIAIAFFIATLLNLFLDLPIIINISCILFGILFGIYYYFSRFKEKFNEIFWFLFLTSCLFIILSWFYNGGISGSATIIALITVALVSLISRGRQLYLSIIIVILTMGILYTIEYHYPGLIIGYQTREDRFIDGYFTFIVAIFISAFVIGYVLQNYRSEREDTARAERNLSQLQNYLSNIIDSMPSAIIGVDHNLKITQWNSQAHFQIGISAEHALNRSILVILPRLKSELKNIKTTINNQTIQKNIRLSHLINGQTYHEELTIYPLREEKDGAGAVIRLDDITEKIRLEGMVIQSDKMLSLGGLAAGMAHEINNPLAGILQNAQLTIHRLTKDIPANQKAAINAGTTMKTIRTFMEDRKILKQLRSIEDAGGRAARIVKNMLSFARKTTNEKKHEGIPELLEQALELAENDYNLKKQYDFKKIKVQTAFDDNVPKVMCESSKIIQVFFNIFSNAAQAVHDDVKKPEGPLFNFNLSTINNKVQIVIEDNGPGMDEKIRKRIFEPFFTTKDVNHGTGLGLSLAYFIIVEDHNGEMEVESIKGKGTKFIIRLPL